MTMSTPAHEFDFRRPAPTDVHAVVRVVNEWWGGRALAVLVQPLFFEHFASTSLIEFGTEGLRAFLIAFDSADHCDITYIHFVGVRPDLRGSGRGRALYQQTFDQAAARGKQRVRSITGLPNRNSIAFHRSMGFACLPGDDVDDEGIPFHRDHGGKGVHHVLFERTI